MQKVLVLIFILFISFSACPEKPHASKDKHNVEFVYISLSKSAKCFHSSRNCQALRKSRKIAKVKRSEIEKSRIPCKHCYYSPSKKRPPNREMLEEPMP